MKRLLLVILAVIIATSVYGQSIRDGNAGYDAGALRKTDFRYYGGATTEPTFTDLGSNQIRVEAITVNLWNNSNFEGYPVSYNLPATTLTLTVGAINYVVADYNNGSPVIKLAASVEDITESNVVPLLTIYNQAGILHTLNWDQLGEGLANKIHQRLVKTQRYQRESGLIVTMANPGVDMSFNVSEGKVWYGATRENILAIDSTSDLVLLVAPNGTTSALTGLVNDSYMNGNVLTPLTNNRYAVNWVYRGIENQKHVYIMLGAGDYSLSDAQREAPPAAPFLITSHAQLIAKIIVQKDSLTVTSIQSAFDQIFTMATTSVHNELVGLNEGDYQHLTAAELAEVQAMDTTYAGINGSATQDFAAKHLDVETASVTSSMSIGDDIDIDITGDGEGNATFDTNNATFTGNVSVEGNLNIQGNFTINNVDVLGDISAALAGILGVTHISELVNAVTLSITEDIYGVALSSDASRMVVSQFDWGTNSMYVLDAQGDNTWAIDYPITLSANNPGYNCTISDDKTAIILTLRGMDGPPAVLAYRWNGSGYSSVTISPMYETSYSHTKRVACSPDGSLVAIGMVEMSGSPSKRFALYKWDGVDSYDEVTIDAPTGATNIFPYFPTNDTLFVGCNDGQRFTWYKDIAGTWTKQPLLDSGNLPSSSTVPPAVTVGVTPQRMTIGGSSNLVTYNYDSGTNDWVQVSTLTPSGSVEAMAGSDDGSLLVVSALDGTDHVVRLYEWDGDSYELMDFTPVSHTSVLLVDVTRDGSIITISGEDFGVKMYERGS